MNRDGRAPVAVFERLRGQRSQPAWRLRPFNSAGLGNEVFFCREIRAQPVYPPGDDKGCREETSRSLLSVRLIRLQAGWRRGSAGDEVTGLPPGRSKGDGFVKWTDRFYRS